LFCKGFWFCHLTKRLDNINVLSECTR